MTIASLEYYHKVKNQSLQEINVKKFEGIETKGVRSQERSRQKVKSMQLQR